MPNLTQTKQPCPLRRTNRSPDHLRLPVNSNVRYGVPGVYLRRAICLVLAGLIASTVGAAFVGEVREQARRLAARVITARRRTRLYGSVGTGEQAELYERERPLAEVSFTGFHVFIQWLALFSPRGTQ